MPTSRVRGRNRGRAPQQQAQTRALDDRLLAGMVQAYRDVWRELEPAVRKLAARIEEARSRGEQPSAAWLVGQARLTGLMDGVHEQLARYGTTAQGRIADSQRSAAALAQDHFGAWVGMGYARLPEEAVSSMVGITHHDGEPLAKTLGRYPKEGADAARRALVTSTALGYGPERTARALRDALGGKLSDYLTVARTETMRAYTRASLETYRANEDMLEGWEWVTAEDERVCAFCAEQDGKLFRLDEEFETHPNCRCTPAPVVKGSAAPSQGAPVVGSDGDGSLLERVGELAVELGRPVERTRGAVIWREKGHDYDAGRGRKGT